MVGRSGFNFIEGGEFFFVRDTTYWDGRLLLEFFIHSRRSDIVVITTVAA